jgi:hypothetical protein
MADASLEPLRGHRSPGRSPHPRRSCGMINTTNLSAGPGEARGGSGGPWGPNGDQRTPEAVLGDLVACVERETAVCVLRAVVVVLVVVPPSSTF